MPAPCSEDLHGRFYGLSMFFSIQLQRLHFSWAFLKEQLSAILLNFLWLAKLTVGRTRKVIPPPWYKDVGWVGWGGVDGTPPRSCWYVEAFRNDFTFGGNPLIFLTREGIFYGGWRCWRPVTSPIIVAILAAIRLKPREMVFFVLNMKDNTQTNALHDFSHKIYFYCWKKLKHVLSLKNGLTTCYLWCHIS